MGIGFATISTQGDYLWDGGATFTLRRFRSLGKKANRSGAMNNISQVDVLPLRPWTCVLRGRLVERPNGRGICKYFQPTDSHGCELVALRRTRLALRARSPEFFQTSRDETDHISMKRHQKSLTESSIRYPSAIASCSSHDFNFASQIVAGSFELRLECCHRCM